MRFGGGQQPGMTGQETTFLLGRFQSRGIVMGVIVCGAVIVAASGRGIIDLHIALLTVTPHVGKIVSFVLLLPPIVRVN